MVSRPVEQMRSSQLRRRLPAGQTRLVKVGTLQSCVFFRRLISHTLGTDHQRIVKLDRENEVAPPAKVAPSVGRVGLLLSPTALCLSYHVKAMQTARMELKLSQKDVAQKINEKPSVLQDYESSKAIPNAQILAKLERVLGVKLRGIS